MILTVQRLVHDAIADADPPPVRPRPTCRRSPSRCRPTARSATSPSRSPSSSRARFARRRARSRRSWRRHRTASPGVARIVAAPNGYLNLYLDRPRVPARARPATRSRLPVAARRKDDRRAHRDQPEQGRAHRPPAQRRARRHAGARAALPRHAGRGAELHRRPRRPGGRYHRRLPRARTADARRGPRTLADTTRFDYYCWDLYARVTEWYEQDRGRLDVRARGAARPRARRQRDRRDGRRSSSTASSARI